MIKLYRLMTIGELRVLDATKKYNLKVFQYYAESFKKPEVFYGTGIIRDEYGTRYALIDSEGNSQVYFPVCNSWSDNKVVNHVDDYIFDCWYSIEIAD